MSNLQSLLQIANQAVDIARDIALTMAPGHVTSKGERDMASEVDYEVERAVRTLLTDLTPHIAFLGEEAGLAAVTEGRQVWALDPIDGTANFIHELPLCGVSLGLIRDGAPVLQGSSICRSWGAATQRRKVTGHTSTGNRSSRGRRVT